ncbi:MAG: hypothetical protein QOH50_482 [Kribbellaceae bacterium]|nr:hypothetical protein [Kribbellaceae bacterium]
MSVFAGSRRRWDLRPNRPLNLAGVPRPGRPEASSGQPRGWREPHGAAGIQRNAYLAIAEALQDGADVVPASDEVRRRLAEEGVSLLEAPDGLGALYRSIAGASRLCGGTRTQFQLGRIDTALSALTVLRGPLDWVGQPGTPAVPARRDLPGGGAPWNLRTGHLRFGGGRAAPPAGSAVRRTRAPAHRRGGVPAHRLLRRLRAGPDRPAPAAAFVGRNPNLPDEVATVRSLITRWRLDSEEPQLVRIWIEGLPGSVE